MSESVAHFQAKKNLFGGGKKSSQERILELHLVATRAGG